MTTPHEIHSFAPVGAVPPAFSATRNVDGSVTVRLRSAGTNKSLGPSASITLAAADWLTFVKAALTEVVPK
jgi:hypothetical protein